MLVHGFFFLAALAVKQDQTPLRSGCEAGDETIATLAAGTTVEVRFRVADGSDCFKIAATVDGKPVVGYVGASALSNVDQFEQQRTAAASLDSSRALNPVEAESKKVVARSTDPALKQASQLLETNQPSRALELLEPLLKRDPRNPDLLLLAGLAAYRADQARTALDYWKQSLDLAPNGALQGIYDKVRRESQADQSGDKLYGLHVALRYEGQTLPADTARAVVATLDQEFSRISSLLGCWSDERIVAIVQSREAYLRSTGAAEWSGGQYDGRIHISWMDGTDVSPEIRRRLAHELVHACITNLSAGGPPAPAWLQEGLAQKLTGDTLSTAARDRLRELAEAHQIPRLEDLRQNWSLLSTANARIAYNLALAAADALYNDFSSYGIRNVVTNPQILQQVTSEIDKKLGL
jgi:tetratricopeptide (TPR) repeat protein